MKSSIDSLFDLNRKIAIVTGGSGMLGGEFVKTLRDAGAKIAIFDLKTSSLEGDTVKTYPVDISNRESISSALDQIKKHWGSPSILVNCAAIDVPPDYGKNFTGGLLETKAQEDLYDKIMEINVKGMLLCCQIIGEEMQKNKEGSIINIGSIYGMVSPDQRIYLKKDSEKKFTKPIAYCVSKSAVYNMTRYLATYFASDGVRVNVLTFGGVFNNQDAEFVKNYCQKVPLNRMAKRDEYNGAVLFLASNASSYMTGSNLVIDGGFTTW